MHTHTHLFRRKIMLAQTGFYPVGGGRGEASVVHRRNSCVANTSISFTDGVCIHIK